MPGAGTEETEPLVKCSKCRHEDLNLQSPQGKGEHGSVWGGRDKQVPASQPHLLGETQASERTCLKTKPKQNQKNNDINNKNPRCWDGEKAQRLTALAALAKDPGSIPSTHIARHNYL